MPNSEIARRSGYHEAPIVAFEYMHLLAAFRCICGRVVKIEPLGARHCTCGRAWHLHMTFLLEVCEDDVYVAAEDMPTNPRGSGNRPDNGRPGR